MKTANAFQIFWWVAIPYFAFGVFVIGTIWRWRYDQYGWTSRSTQLQERKFLKWGAPLFHYATFAAIGGHILGILIPAAVTNFLGIPDHAYHIFATVAGTVAAVLVIAGIAFLAFRRVFIPRVRATTSPVDWFALILILVIVITGTVPTIWNLFGLNYDYRDTVGVWFRGLFTGHPRPEVMITAPLVYKIHATAAWSVWIVWPFTRLVHAFSYPLRYLVRPYIVFRSKVASGPNEPGTSGRRWRRIGQRF
ncbi:respiratory nitrate reductase subunit gamma [Microlunatus elymi]|uniref:Nitrate reductase-like protein NarX n=1 Tax=Microlunatus elymi TaxID=2596828 RepID=A0A516Q099_9ACTN|nr:respiratory nitrate reductase subunit gamma [Microlunatus elymi]QDP96865.1 respiratory nitrate reductase subunit gamma [Microlunatus elymi]